jgi:hypothetical protein
MRCLLFATYLVFLIGCVGQERSTSRPGADAVADDSTLTLVIAQEGRGWGTIKGQIIWGKSDIPERQPIKAIQDHADKKVCLAKGDVLDEQFVINPKNKGVRWTFVWLADAQGAQKDIPIHPSLKDIKDKEVVMDQPACQFEPHALGMREGQILVAKNSAPMPHNFKYSGGIENPGSNPLIPPGGQVPIKGLKAERIPVIVECGIHPWMKAWVRVFTHPYFAVTDENGSFEIKNAPAGDYRLIVWHEGIGYLGGAKGKTGQPIQIKAGEATALKLELK